VDTDLWLSGRDFCVFLFKNASSLRHTGEPH
jgi:hypothetical protein